MSISVRRGGCAAPRWRNSARRGLLTLQKFLQHRGSGGELLARALPSGLEAQSLVERLLGAVPQVGVGPEDHHQDEG